jgi:DNA replication initiation complex subunit (GINS family)
VASGQGFGYDTLAAALADERATKDIVQLKRGFVGEAQKALGEARAAVKKAEARDTDSAEAELARQNLKMMRTKVKQIINLRVEKVVRLAVHDAEVGRTAPVDRMLEEELKFYMGVHALAKLFAARLHVTAALEGDDRVKALEKEAAHAIAALVPALRAEPEEEPDDLITIHVLADVEEFVWKGGRRMRARKGDVMNVPKGLADVLLANGSAERAE